MYGQNSKNPKLNIKGRKPTTTKKTNINKQIKTTAIYCNDTKRHALVLYINGNIIYHHTHDDNICYHLPMDGAI